MKSSRAFTMPEMLIALSLLAVVGLLAAWIFQSTMKLQYQTVSAHDLLGRTQRVKDLLGRDTWSAADLQVTAEQAVLVMPDGKRVTWRVDAQALLRQGDDASGAVEQRWDIAADARFVRQGPVLHVHLAPANGEPAVLHFVSQLLMAGEGR